MVHPQASIVGFQPLQFLEVVDLMVHPYASIVGIIHTYISINLLKERQPQMIL